MNELKIKVIYIISEEVILGLVGFYVCFIFFELEFKDSGVRIIINLIYVWYWVGIEFDCGFFIVLFLVFCNFDSIVYFLNN